ncbi:LuxR C-terminal-related transcriptional regulator [Streptomyces sp. NBC_01384]|uniref:LuxR C-terminal-related transcriptional regulator n=1 Tax=Streptomyces sp. NBC_01384 TaxID=2903847 RepID=UPI00386F0927
MCAAPRPPGRTPPWPRLSRSPCTRAGPGRRPARHSTRRTAWLPRGDWRTWWWERPFSAPPCSPCAATPKRPAPPYSAPYTASTCPTAAACRCARTTRWAPPRSRRATTRRRTTASAPSTPSSRGPRPCTSTPPTTTWPTSWQPPSARAGPRTHGSSSTRPGGASPRARRPRGSTRSCTGPRPCSPNRTTPNGTSRRRWPIRRAISGPSNGHRSVSTTRSGCAVGAARWRRVHCSPRRWRCSNGLGARPWTERARAELRAAGVTPAASPSTALDALAELTPQQLQIARLAAAGLTNREIGERIFLSPRTIGFHLYRIFPKLGITSRAQLRDALPESRK